MTSELSTLCAERGVEIKSTYLGVAAEIGGKTIPDMSFKWRVTLTYQGRKASVDYYTGLGNVNDPPAGYHFGRGEVFNPTIACDWLKTVVLFGADFGAFASAEH